ncbi:MAG: carboxypeptidase regulatory-like domain-containing protein [Sphingobacteriales bacterium]|nr:MAG: carboxypeptidase regulatory-like domain-containing protein [Sphingobacteriales bacterium]
MKQMLLVAIVLLFVSNSFAKGWLTGRITDDKGIEIDAITIEIKDSTGKTVAAYAGYTDNGKYLFNNLAAGVYTIIFSADKQVFTPLSFKNFTVYENRPTVIDVVMNVRTDLHEEIIIKRSPR